MSKCSLKRAHAQLRIILLRGCKMSSVPTSYLKIPQINRGVYTWVCLEFETWLLIFGVSWIKIL